MGETREAKLCDSHIQDRSDACHCNAVSAAFGPRFRQIPAIRKTPFPKYRDECPSPSLSGSGDRMPTIGERIKNRGRAPPEHFQSPGKSLKIRSIDVGKTRFTPRSEAFRIEGGHGLSGTGDGTLGTESRFFGNDGQGISGTEIRYYGNGPKVPTRVESMSRKTFVHRLTLYLSY